MHRPIISPKIIAIRAAHDETGAPFSWVELATVVPGGGAATIDLLVNASVLTVEAAIARARSGVLVAVITSTGDTNPYTGRPWYRGEIGSASELDLPPMANIGDEEDEFETAIVAPKVLRVYPGIEASDYLGETSCIDLIAGGTTGLMHVAVRMRVYEVENFLKHAKAVRRALVFWHGRAIGIKHKSSGALILIGHIDRLSASDRPPSYSIG